jgi:hypothetical protein
MASHPVPYNMFMRTTHPRSNNAVSYHNLGWHFQMPVPL